MRAARPLPNLGAGLGGSWPWGQLQASSRMADLPYWASGNQWNNSACSLRTPGTPSPKRGAQSHAPDPLLDGRHGPQVTEERTEEYSERRCGPVQSPRAGGCQSWAINTHYPGGPENGGAWTWELLVHWEVQKGGEAVLAQQLAAPQEPASPPPTPGPTLLLGSFSHPEPHGSLHLPGCQDSGCASLPLPTQGAGRGLPKAGHPRATRTLEK